MRRRPVLARYILRVCLTRLQVVAVAISVAYYVLRKRELKQQAAILMDDANAQMMVSVAQPSRQF